MKTPRILITFSGYSDAGLKSKAEIIVASVEEHSETFKDPVPTIAELLDAINSFHEAMAAAADGSRTQIAIKKARRKELEQLLRNLATYVAFIAKGDRAILTSSGFDVEKEADSKTTIVSPETITVESGNNSGELIVKVNTVKGAKAYSYEYAQDPLTDSTVRITEVDTRTTHLLTDLPTGKKFWLRVGAVGTAGTIAYSNEVSCIVQ